MCTYVDGCRTNLMGIHEAALWHPTRNPKSKPVVHMYIMYPCACCYHDLMCQCLCFLDSYQWVLVLLSNSTDYNSHRWFRASHKDYFARCRFGVSCAEFHPAIFLNSVRNKMQISPKTDYVWAHLTGITALAAFFFCADKAASTRGTYLCW